MAIVKRLASEDYVSAQATEITVEKLSEHVTSWNDLTDRPFGEVVSEVSIVSTSFEASYNRKFGCDIADINGSLNLEAGKTYTIIFNDFTYPDLVCYVESNDSCLALGDSESCYGGDGTFSTYSFSIHDKGDTWRFFTPHTGETTFDETACTVEITTNMLKTVPLSEGFIPDTIARVSTSVPTPTTASVGQTIIVKAIDESGKPTEWECVNIERPFMTQVTLTTANWDDYTRTQNVTVSGIFADTTAQNIQCNPVPASMYYAIESGLYCSAQADDALTFSCSVIPTEDITLNVVWQNVYYVS